MLGKVKKTMKFNTSQHLNLFLNKIINGVINGLICNSGFNTTPIAVKYLPTEYVN